MTIPQFVRAFDVPDDHADPERARVSIIPVPYDATSSWVKGADRGPAALLAASHHVEFLDLETMTEPWKHGIATLAPVVGPSDPADLVAAVRARVDAELAAGRLPVVIGGEHSVTIGAVEAAADRHPGVGVLQVDAHGDTRESYHGSPYNHACVMARARERCPIVQVGTRALDPDEFRALDRERLFLAHEIVDARPDRAWIDRVIAKLPEQVYLTIDLDAFDPSIIAATGTPEPGGLDWAEVNALVAAVASRRTIVAFDVVELCPHEAHHASAFTAAKLVYRCLAEILR